MTSKIPCGPCSGQGKSLTAVRFCSDCEDHLCKDCTESHSKFKQLKSHYLVELSKASILQSGLIKKYCSAHDDVPLDFFCTQHDTVCCRMCMPVSHQSCKSVLPLEIAAKDIKNSALKKDTMTELANIEETLEKLLYNRNLNIESLEKTKSAILKQVTDVKNEIITHVNKLEQDIFTRLSTLTMHNKTKIENQKFDLTKLSVAVTKSKIDLNNLIDHGSDNHLFLALHHQKNELLNKIKQLQESMKEIHDINIVFDRMCCTKPDALGTISESSRPIDMQYRPLHLQQAQVTPEPLENLSKFRSEGKVNLKSGISYNITGIAITEENKLLLCNHTKETSSVFVYHNCEIYDGEIRFESEPYDVAVIPGKETLLVTLPNTNYIQFVDPKTMKKGQTVSIDKNYYGIHATEDKIVLGGDQNILVLDIEGKRMKKIHLSHNEYIFSVIVRSESLDIICRSIEFICCIQFNGRKVFEYNIEGGGQSGIAVDRRDNVYLCGSNNIERLAADGTFRDIILKHNDGISYPYTLCFSNDFSRLVVVNGCKSVQTFTCS